MVILPTGRATGYNLPVAVDDGCYRTPPTPSTATSTSVKRTKSASSVPSFVNDGGAFDVRTAVSVHNDVVRVSVPDEGTVDALRTVVVA
jgi:hypothetical protein